WKGYFLQLGRLHCLDQQNPIHLLHSLFLGSINNDCMDFQSTLNFHLILGGGHNMSPMVHPKIVSLL
ncbi:hypothetical protein P691DRAFT_686757, partial [Macrolepiota fuliginosa MF-IS2]